MSLASGFWFLGEGNRVWQYNPFWQCFPSCFALLSDSAVPPNWTGLLRVTHVVSRPGVALKSVSHENHALTQWFRWVTHGPAHGRRWKAPFLDFLQWHNARADSLLGSPWFSASSQPAALTSRARCPGFIDALVSMEGVRCLVSPKTGPFCELSWKSGKLCSSSLRYKEKGVLLCAFRFTSRSSRQSRLARLRAPSLAMAVAGRGQAAACLLLRQERLVQANRIIHVHRNSGCSSEVTLQKPQNNYFTWSWNFFSRLDLQFINMWDRRLVIQFIVCMNPEAYVNAVIYYRNANMLFDVLFSVTWEDKDGILYGHL